MHKQTERFSPILWGGLGKFRHYILFGYFVFGISVATVWFLLQIAVIDHDSLTPRSEAFSGGIGLVMMLIVLGTVSAAVAVEDVLITREAIITRRIEAGRAERDARLKMLTDALERNPNLTLVMRTDEITEES